MMAGRRRGRFMTRNASRPRSLQLLRVRRSRDGRELRRDALRRADRADAARGSGAGARRVSRRCVRPPHSRRRQQAPGARRSRWPSAARSSPASTRRREMLSVARARAADAGSGDRVRRRRRARAGVSRSGVRRRRVPARADARAGLAHGAVGDCAAWRAHRLVFDYPALGSAAALQAVWRRAALTHGTARSRRTACSARGDVARELRRHGFRITATHNSSCCRLRFTKRIGSAAIHARPRRRAWPAPACCGSPARP